MKKYRFPLLIVLTAIALLGAGGAWLLHKPFAKSAVASCTLPAENTAAPHAGMVWVPGGSFVAGDSVYPEEKPAGMTTLAGFWMDRSEVTNDEFASFVKATGYVTVAERAVDLQKYGGLPPAMQKPGAVVFTMPKKISNDNDIRQWWRYVPGADWRHPAGPDSSIEGHGAFPVVHVTYADALAYAKWKGRTLPTEAQWEWAARGAQQQAKPEHEQPQQANTWQGLFPMANSSEDGYVGLAPVGCYAPNALGLFDMIGNVWELTSDRYRPSHAGANESHDQLPPELQNISNSQRTIKGGSYLCAPNYCMRYRSAARQPQDEDLAVSHLGFRTVLLAPGP